MAKSIKRQRSEDKPKNKYKRKTKSIKNLTHVDDLPQEDHQFGYYIYNPE